MVCVPPQREAGSRGQFGCHQDRWCGGAQSGVRASRPRPRSPGAREPITGASREAVAKMAAVEGDSNGSLRALVGRVRCDGRSVRCNPSVPLGCRCAEGSWEGSIQCCAGSVLPTPSWHSLVSSLPNTTAGTTSVPIAAAFRRRSLTGCRRPTPARWHQLTRGF